MSDDWTISASKIKMAEECPEKFRLRYIERYDEMGPDNRWIRRGNAVHEAIEDALSEASDPSVSSATLKAQYRENGGAAGYQLDEGFHEQVLASFDAASRFLRRQVEEVRDLELEIEFGVDRATITRDFGGYIDLATDDAVVDWKTGKSEGKDAADAIQGAVYMAGYAHEYGHPPESIHFVYANPEAGDDHPKVRTIDPDDDLWDELLGKARKLLAIVESGEFEARPDEANCHFCDFEVFCPASPVGAGDIDWEAYP